MHSVFTQVSGLAALLILFRELWAQAPLDHALLTSLGAGLGVYLVLVAVQAALRHIIYHTPTITDTPPSADSKPADTAAAPDGVGDNAALAS